MGGYHCPFIPIKDNPKLELTFTRIFKDKIPQLHEAGTRKPLPVYRYDYRLYQPLLHRFQGNDILGPKLYHVFAGFHLSRYEKRFVIVQYRGTLSKHVWKYDNLGKAAFVLQIDEGHLLPSSRSFYSHTIDEAGELND